MERLDGKRIIITGGASGMGRTTVENFPALGAKVAFFDVNDKDGEEVAKISGAKYIHVDVSNPEEVEKGFKEAVEYMKDQHYGNIINFTSASAFIVSPWHLCYGASKGAVTSWTRTLAKVLMPYMIRVNMIAPNIYTPLSLKLVAQMSPEDKEKFYGGMKGLMLGDQKGDPIEDYLPVAAFMASDSSKFITGQTICVDGGTMMVR